MAVEEVLPLQRPLGVELNKRQVGVGAHLEAALPGQPKRRAGKPAVVSAMRASEMPRAW